MSADREQKKNLPRLSPDAYRGLAIAHWVFNIEERKTGWLNTNFFYQFQLMALHAFSRYHIASPCICLMPDHIHLLLMGYSRSSDQRLAVTFMRKHLKPALAPFAFQRTPYDHVLRKNERNPGEFAKMAGYIRQNPFRAGLTKSEDIPWEFECCSVPGYPDLSPSQEDFWDVYWKIYYGLVEKHE